MGSPSYNVDISSNIHPIESGYFGLGEVSDVYRCRYSQPDGSTQIVAVKVMRGLSSDPGLRAKFKEDIVNLVMQWRHLWHPNVMQCFGTCSNLGHLTGFVLPVCNQGTITQYLLQEPSSKKLQMLLEVASGVKYLHYKKFVHADIRGSNILVRDGIPLIMDGGLAPLLNRGDFTVVGVCGRSRWMAPEVLDPPDEVAYSEESPYTFESDIYSLGMTILEVLTGKIPYHYRRYDTVVMLDVIRGVKPRRPEVSIVSDQVWDIIKSCWSYAKHRPSATLVEAWLNMARYIAEHG